MMMTYAAAIIIGAAILALPWSRTESLSGRPLLPFFLATSSVCVTGMSPVDIGTFLTPFGQAVLLILVQLGGLGIMTFGTFVFEVMGHKLSVQNEQVVMSSLGIPALGRVHSILLRTVVFTVFWETLGALILGARLFFCHGFSIGQAAYHGTFHSIAAFCNAGFSLYPENMVRFAHDPVILLIVAGLVIIGGLGFIVLANLSQQKPWKRNHNARGRLTLHSRIILVGTAFLLIGGMLGIYFLELRQTLQDAPVGERWLQAFFHSVTCRSSGFSVTDVAQMRGITKVFSMFLMFIGGAPGSMAGGIKVSTLVVLASTVYALMRNRETIEFGKREIPAHVVRESIVITVLSCMVVVLMMAVVHVTEGATGTALSPQLLFVTVSAFGTVGLSEGAISTLTQASFACLMVCMFVGRLGPLTLALTIRDVKEGVARRYPKETVIVG